MSSDLKSARSKRKTDSKLNVPNAATLAEQMQVHFSENSDADYILAVKANHPTLHEQVKTWFEQAIIYQL